MKTVKFASLLIVIVIVLAACAPVGNGTPLATPTAVPGPVGQGGTWSLVFNDEFDGSSVDLVKWRPNWLGSSDTAVTNPINSYEQNCYDPNLATVSDGMLHLNIVANTSSACKTRSGAQALYRSGMVQSWSCATCTDGYKYTFGYIEFRAKFPVGTDHKSVWPAMWTDGAGLNWPTTGEIDVVEGYGVDTSTSYHYHYKSSSGGNVSIGGNATVAGSTTGFHTYAAWWQPGKVTWYYDGVQVWQYSTGIISVPHFIIINLGTGPNTPTAVTLPAEMLVDYVRVWTGTSGPTSTPGAATSTPTITRTRTATLTPVLATSTPTRTITPSRTATWSPVPSQTEMPSTPTPSETLTPSMPSWCQTVILDAEEFWLCKVPK